MIDLAVVNAKVWTVNPRQPVAEAVAVRGERIAAVGSNAEVRRLISGRAEVLDAAGRLVLPGFNDAHVHFVNSGMSLLSIDLRPARDEQEFAAILARYAAGLPKGRWVTGGQWDHEAWPSRARPSRQLIDPLTAEQPVLVRRLDGHISLANSLALRLAAIGRQTPDPPGGQIVRDSQGEPTGILIDTAQDLVQRVIPQPSEAELLEGARAAMRHAAGLGVTSVQSMSDARELSTLQKLHERGELATRVCVYLSCGTPEQVRAARDRMIPGDSLLRTAGVKIFTDGSFGAASALLFTPYDDHPGSCGLAIHDEGELQAMLAEAGSARMQVAIHAIGERAVNMALNALGPGAARERGTARPRIEHAQMVRPDDRPRFAALDVIASIQPSHCIDDMRWIEKRIGRRTVYAYPFKSLLDTAARVAVGTDWYVEPLDPMLGLYAAVTREFPQGGPAGGWHPEEKVSLGEAIAAYTLGSAYAEFQEREKGSIEPGRLADMVILSNDILTCPPREILCPLANFEGHKR